MTVKYKARSRATRITLSTEMGGNAVEMKGERKK